MLMENKICEECGKSFDYVLNPRFPRKYCGSCSEAKKASYKAGQTLPVEKMMSDPSVAYREKMTGEEVVRPINPVILKDPKHEKYRTPEEMIACEILKCATELTCVGTPDGATMGEQLANAVTELTGAYKLALSNVKAL